MSVQIHSNSYYIKKFNLKSGTKVFYYNQIKGEIQEWWYLDETQNYKLVFENGHCQQGFSGEMMNLCALTRDDCRILIFKQRISYMNERIKRHQQQITAGKDEINIHKAKIGKYLERISQERISFDDVITKYPEEFI